MSHPGAAVSDAFRDACRLELRALKPGNIGSHGEARGMTVADFEKSAAAAAPVMGAPDLSVGLRILRAIEATRTVVTHNTNLGIVLLAAPLSQAALAGGDDTLRERLASLLAALTVGDARDAYAAIRMAEPGGLDTVRDQDIRSEPTVTLLDAMRMADPRDRVATQYTNDFADIFEIGLPFFAAALARTHSAERAASALYMHFLARFPDALIARKYGSDAAAEVQSMAADLNSELEHIRRPEDARAELLAFDAWLKAHALNPGATADLVVATLFASRLNPA